jgi:hypothetical protein
MTKEELDILKQLSIIGQRVNDLPVIYEDPNGESRSEVFLHINALERMVFARDGQRAYLKSIAGEIINKMEKGIPAKILRAIKAEEKTIAKKKQTAKKKKSPGRPAKKKPGKKSVKYDIRNPKTWRKPFSKPSA